MTHHAAAELFDPNRLFDTLQQMLDLENDEALSHVLHVEPYLIKRVREGVHPIDPALLIRINEATGINMRDLRQMMGDRRTEYRLDTSPPPVVAPVKEAVEKHGEGEERDKLRRSFERDDTGLPNFVQWS
ncbi:hypothetical protein [Noviherbaspirillum denitrificans]|uniref:DNA-binding protein n=1 Tax=Noviherbaspirillum denitrificans TaxID=1968433 RepID=A0A254TRU5_9BURK|nr:hypothetical protein [Noviherbaspirillum denitrificans]OWW22448.1 hypothetical protein AYR66_26070 [Noviherbaspirillum denitrificans]